MTKYIDPRSRGTDSNPNQDVRQSELLQATALEIQSQFLLTKHSDNLCTYRK